MYASTNTLSFTIHACMNERMNEYTHKGLANKRRRCVIGQDLQVQNTFSAASETANSLESRCVYFPVRPSLPLPPCPRFPACPLTSLPPSLSPSHGLLHMPIIGTPDRRCKSILAGQLQWWTISCDIASYCLKASDRQILCRLSLLSLSLRQMKHREKMSPHLTLFDVAQTVQEAKNKVQEAKQQPRQAKCIHVVEGDAGPSPSIPTKDTFFRRPTGLGTCEMK